MHSTNDKFKHSQIRQSITVRLTERNKDRHPTFPITLHQHLLKPIHPESRQYASCFPRHAMVSSQQTDKTHAKNAMQKPGLTRHDILPSS
jgi:hypothetical protein